MKGIEIKNIASTACYCLKFVSASRLNVGYAAFACLQFQLNFGSFLEITSHAHCL